MRPDQRKTNPKYDPPARAIRFWLGYIVFLCLVGVAFSDVPDRIADTVLEAEATGGDQ